MALHIIQFLLEHIHLHSLRPNPCVGIFQLLRGGCGLTLCLYGFSQRLGDVRFLEPDCLQRESKSAHQYFRIVIATDFASLRMIQPFRLPSRFHGPLLNRVKLKFHVIRFHGAPKFGLR